MLVCIKNLKYQYIAAKEGRVETTKRLETRTGKEGRWPGDAGNCGTERRGTAAWVRGRTRGRRIVGVLRSGAGRGAGTMGEAW